MIVDDSSPIRAMIKQYVQSLWTNHEFYECSDGLEAIRAYRQLRPDWVLMDIKMAGMDGLAAANTIVQEFPDARIVFVTNFDDRDLREAARRSGALGYVMKERLSDLSDLMH